MAVFRTQTALSADIGQADQTFEDHTSRQLTDVSAPMNTPAPDSRENTSSSGSNHHTAFLQCRACCNCDSGCSYYGKGKFDARGNYLGS